MLSFIAYSTKSSMRANKSAKMAYNCNLLKKLALGFVLLYESSVFMNDCKLKVGEICRSL